MAVCCDRDASGLEPVKDSKMASVSTGQNKFQTVFQCFVPDAQDVEGVRGRLSAMTVSRDIYGQFSCNLSEIPMSQRSGRRCMWREYILMKNQNRNNGKLASPGSMLRILHRLETAVKTEDKEKVSKQSELDRTTRVHFRYSALPHGRMYNREVPEGTKYDAMKSISVASFLLVNMFIVNKNEI